jgi:hypothetical protein
MQPPGGHRLRTSSMARSPSSTQPPAATTSSLIPRIAIPRFMAYSMARSTLLTSNARQLDDLLEDDVFRASVTVLGKMDYDIQIGGYTTVPLLEVNSIKVIG